MSHAGQSPLAHATTQPPARMRQQQQQQLPTEAVWAAVDDSDLPPPTDLAGIFAWMKADSAAREQKAAARDAEARKAIGQLVGLVQGLRASSTAFENTLKLHDSRLKATEQALAGVVGLRAEHEAWEREAREREEAMRMRLEQQLQQHKRECQLALRQSCWDAQTQQIRSQLPLAAQTRIVRLVRPRGPAQSGPPQLT